MWVRRAGCDRDERGSLIVAMTVVLVLTGLSLGVLARTLSALQSGRRNQDRAAARTAAEAGLAEALYDLNNLPPDIPHPSPEFNFLESEHSSPCASASASCFRWRAYHDFSAKPGISDPPGNSNAYTIKSIGTVNGVSRTLTESVFRWPLVLFADQGITLDGVPGPRFPPAISAGSFIGSNGGIVMKNDPGGGDQQNIFGPLASCSGCRNPAPAPGPYAIPGNQYATKPVVPTGAPCFGTYNSAIGIPAGPNVCTGVVALVGDLKVLGTPSNPSVIFMTSGTLSLGALTMTTSTEPTSLVIHVVPPATITPVPGVVFGFVGALDAPQADLTCPPLANWNITGALKLKSFTCTAPAPAQLHLTYDQRVGHAMAYPWEVSGLREIPTPASL